MQSERVVLVVYDPAWPLRFERESEALRAILEPRGLKALEHVGSTAIPGIAAKPIVDIVAGMERMERVPSADDSFWTDAGYEYGHGDDRPDDWQYFIKRGDAGERLVHLHVVPFGGAFWTRILAFRDALRDDFELARQYEKLKLELAARFADERLRYVDGKGDFVNAVIASRTVSQAVRTRITGNSTSANVKPASGSG
jgi:GrpB-like predicted nucleotidyltransferase (UPF0157 family)